MFIQIHHILQPHPSFLLYPPQIKSKTTNIRKKTEKKQVNLQTSKLSLVASFNVCSSSIVNWLPSPQVESNAAGLPSALAA